jgi:hypothetical protein
MARIPGKQPTAGLEGFYLVESPAWMPAPADSGDRIAAVVGQVLDQWAAGTVAPNGRALDQAGLVETAMGEAIQEGNNRASAAAIDAAGTATLLPDDISPNFAAVDGAIAAGVPNLGGPPGIDPNIPPPPEVREPPGKGDSGV